MPKNIKWKIQWRHAAKLDQIVLKWLRKNGFVVSLENGILKRTESETEEKRN